jgi:hypothetical protein
LCFIIEGGEGGGGGVAGRRRKGIVLLLHVLCLVTGCKLSHSITKKLRSSVGGIWELKFQMLCYKMLFAHLWKKVQGEGIRLYGVFFPFVDKYSRLKVKTMFGHR